MPNFDYSPPFLGTVPSSESTFARSFTHLDWVDGQDVVQAGSTPDEVGFNVRLHALEADLDAIRGDLRNAYRLIGELRSALAVALVQIRDEVNKKTEKPSKEGKEGKDSKDTKEGKDSKDGKETKEGKDGKETKEGKDHKDGKETKEGKEFKDGKEVAFKEREEFGIEPGSPPLFVTPALNETPAVGRAFIRIHERPTVGERLFRGSSSGEAE